jgi:hypothetical protein
LLKQQTRPAHTTRGSGTTGEAMMDNRLFYHQVKQLVDYVWEREHDDFVNAEEEAQQAHIFRVIVSLETSLAQAAGATAPQWTPEDYLREHNEVC